MAKQYDFSLMKEMVTEKMPPQEIAATLDVIMLDYAKRLISDQEESPTQVHSDRLHVLFIVRNAFFKMTGDVQLVTNDKL